MRHYHDHHYYHDRRRHRYYHHRRRHHYYYHRNRNHVSHRRHLYLEWTRSYSFKQGGSLIMMLTSALVDLFF